MRRRELRLATVIKVWLFLILGLGTSMLASGWAKDRADTSALAATKSKSIALRLEPSEQEMTLESGGHYTGSVSVYSTSRAGIDIVASVAPFQTSTDGIDFAIENDFTQLYNWITLPQTEYHADANQAAVIQFEIDVPEDAVASGQYAAILIQVVETAEEEEAEGGITVIPQIAALVYGHINGADADLAGELIEQKFPNIILGGDFTLSATFQNTGNIDMRVVEAMTIRDFFTNEELINPSSVNDYGFPLGITYANILPGATNEVGLTWSEAPQLGLFRVEWSVDFLGEIHTYEKVILICPIWLVVLIGAFVVLLILWIITSILERRDKKPQVF